MKKNSKSTLENLKNNLKQYGKLGSIIYFSISITTLSSFYYILITKKLDPNKFVDKIQQYELSRYVPIEKIKKLTNTDGAYFAIAIVLNKLFIFLRLPLTLIILYIFKRFK